MRELASLAPSLYVNHALGCIVVTECITYNELANPGKTAEYMLHWHGLCCYFQEFQLALGAWSYSTQCYSAIKMKALKCKTLGVEFATDYPFYI